MILPVLHVGPHDTALAIAALEASVRLEGQLDAVVYVYYTKGVNESCFLFAVKKAFKQVELREYDDWSGEAKWPYPQNHAWQFVARAMIFRTGFSGWLWWEADAVPVRKGWLKALTDSHESSGKIFTGCAVRNHTTQPYMNGVGIWPMKPIEALQNCAALYDMAHPFDINAGRAVMASFNDASHLIVHERKLQGGGAGRTFNSNTLKGFLFDHPQTVFYHGCTDGSLHALVGSFKEPERTPTLPSQMRKTEPASPVIGAHRYIHCVERHIYPNQPDNERVLVAFNSWVTLYKTGRMVPCHQWHYPRDSRATGDVRGLPYLKDILIEGMTLATQPNDIILLSNDDTIFHSNILQALDQKLTLVDAIGSMRLNFPDRRSLPGLDTPIERVVASGVPDLGRDLMAFKKSWLLANWDLIPDFFLGELEWDVVMAVLIRRSAALVTNRVNITAPAYECELPRGYVLHIQHDRAWFRKENATNPAKLHNCNLAQVWYKEHFPEMLEK